MAAHLACDPPASRVRAIVVALALLTRGVLGHAAGPVATEEGPPRRYVGAAACSSNNCHGSVTPRLDSKRSMQNEYVTWYKSDRHAKAYEALVGERALRIARLLGMVDASAAPATWLEQTPRAERCLACHTLNVPAGLRAPKFNLEDGVSCEACHGPANAWLTKHTERGWDPAQSLGLGMLDTTDPGRAAETCLTCHLGTSTVVGIPGLQRSAGTDRTIERILGRVVVPSQSVGSPAEFVGQAVQGLGVTQEEPGRPGRPSHCARR